MSKYNDAYLVVQPNYSADTQFSKNVEIVLGCVQWVSVFNGAHIVRTCKRKEFPRDNPVEIAMVNTLQNGNEIVECLLKNTLWSQSS
jgi:hypothetical protein